MKSTFKVSRHAKERIRQRGIADHLVAFVLQNFDMEIPARQGCRQVFVSRREAARLVNAGTDFRIADRSRSVALFIAQDGTIVTAMRMDASDRRRGRLKQRGAITRVRRVNELERS